MVGKGCGAKLVLVSWLEAEANGDETRETLGTTTLAKWGTKCCF